MPSGATHQLSYDAVGQLQQQVDALGQTVAQFEYDARGLLLSQQDALGQNTEFEYDVLGRLAAEESALTQRTEFDYDALNRLVSSVDALQGESTQGFNADGQRVSLTDPNDNTTQFVFDQNGRLVSAATATGHTVQYQYNARNLLTQITNARGQAQQLSYDAIGRLVSLSDAVGQIQYTYDANGNVLTVTDSLGTITRTYDALNRVTAYSDTRGNSLAYQYDAVGNLTRLTYPDGKQVQYAYDVNDQLITVTDWASRVTQYAYDANGRLSQTTRPNGTQQLRSYDAKGQLLTQTEQDAQGQVLFSYQFSYDAVGNIVAETVEPNLATLLPANTEMSYGLANRLATVDQQSVILDADGNMVEGVLQGALTQFSFDARNRLTQAGSTQYQYDAENQRIAVDATQFVVNSQPSLSQVLVRTKGNGEVTYYVYGLGLIGEQSAGNYFSYLFDYRGSTVAITDTTGQVIDTVQYSPFGVVLSQPIFDTPFLFNGLYGVMTDDNSLSYMRARYYSAEIRRFVNQDVLLGDVADGQSLNRFAFVTGNPIRYTDPWGLEVFDWTDGFDTSGYEDGDGAALNRDQSIEMLLLTIDGIDLGSDVLAACTALPSGGASLALNFQKKALVEAIERALKEYSKKQNKQVAKGAADRANELHSVLDQRAQRMRTTAVTETKQGIYVVSSSNNRLSPAQRAQLGKNEIEGIGKGHAEVTGVNAAKNAGLTPTGTAASRPICSKCADFLKEQGVDPLSPLK